jgi:hypothetical protein
VIKHEDGRRRRSLEIIAHFANGQTAMRIVFEVR